MTAQAAAHFTSVTVTTQSAAGLERVTVAQQRRFPPEVQSSGPSQPKFTPVGHEVPQVHLPPEQQHVSEHDASPQNVPGPSRQSPRQSTSSRPFVPVSELHAAKRKAASRHPRRTHRTLRASLRAIRAASWIRTGPPSRRRRPRPRPTNESSLACRRSSVRRARRPAQRRS